MTRILRKLTAIALTALLCAGIVLPASAICGNCDATIAGGMTHTVFVKDDGTVWTFGSTDSGGSDVIGSRQVLINNVISVAAGSVFTAALRFDGTVYVWDSNKSAPSAVPGLSSINAISAGQSTLLALGYNGDVWQWTYGTNAAPVKVNGLPGNITAIAAGGGHYLALTGSGEVWSWGRNSDGQLGIGTKNSSNTPKRITTLYDIVDIAAGFSHSLAVSFGGSVYAWGSNNYGELGNGTTEASDIPVKIESLSKVSAVSGGNGSSLALTTGGKVYAWGYGEYGQLGNNSTQNSQSKPVTVGGNYGKAMLIASGMYHNLLVNDRGVIYVWGRNRDGQLGISSNSNALSPQKCGTVTDSNLFTLTRYQTNTLQGLSAWSVKEATWLYDQHMISPLLWSNYTTAITRGEFAHLIVNIYEKVKNTETSPSRNAKFGDIKGNLMETDILKAFQLGMIKGRSEKVFAPDDKVTRQEAAKMLCDLVALLKNTRISTKIIGLSYYNDASEVSSWAIPYVAYAHDQNIMQGTGDSFRPLQNITREQALLIAARMINNNGWAKD